MLVSDKKWTYSKAFIQANLTSLAIKDYASIAFTSTVMEATTSVCN